MSEQFGRPETLLADNGYFSEANVMQCAAAKIEPLIATGRQPSVFQRCNKRTRVEAHFAVVIEKAAILS